tara:strand:- start:16603 stop:18144 length:1542 start_codon:yes stop_codon:yes gene_type:complete
MFRKTVTNFSDLPSTGRRAFLKSLAAGASMSASPAVMSTLMSLHAASDVMADAGDPSDYKALVCVFLLGGNDSFNMLTPYGPANASNLGGEYADYVAARGGVAGESDGVALPKSPDRTNPDVWRQGLWRIRDSDTSRYFGLHPGMKEIRNLFNQGNCACIANVGSLVRPTTMNDFDNGVSLPLGLFSHSDLIRHWQTADPATRSQKTGWGGRLGGEVKDQNTSGTVAMNISLGGVNIFQTGGGIVPYSVSTNGAEILDGLGSTDERDRLYAKFTNRMIAGLNVNSTSPRRYDDLFEKTFTQSQSRAKRAAATFEQGLEDCPLDQETIDLFPPSRLGSQMLMVAKSIAARSEYGHNRQIFFVGVGGWDHHDEVMNAQSTLLPEVSQAIHAFYQATVDLSVADKVTTFTASDFGRTLSSNGNGTDHAWGGNHLVVGGSVAGGQVYGDYPTDLTNPTFDGGSIDTGRGRLIPTTAVDEYARELVQWFGVPAGDLNKVLPNIGNFQGVGRPRIRFLG